jgi:drug/metabolite transporter (DMT)-like permease
VLALLALGALGTAVAFVVTTDATGKIGATRASSTAFLIPPVALLLGVLVRHEHVAPLAILGGAACVGGAWLTNRAQRRSVAAPRPLAATAPSQAAMGTRP